MHSYLHFLYSCFSKVFSFSFCTRSDQIQIIFKQIYLTLDGILTGTTILDQSGPGSNANEIIFQTPKSSEVKPNHQIQIRVLTRTPAFNSNSFINIGSIVIDNFFSSIFTLHTEAIKNKKRRK